MSVERPRFPQIPGELDEFRRVLDNYIFQLNEFVNSVGSPGVVLAFAGSVAPSGWVLCDGTEYDRNKFPELFKAIGTTWGSSSPTVFAVPDFRGKILFGASGGYPLAGAGITGASGAGLSSVAIHFIIKV